MITYNGDSKIIKAIVDVLNAISPVQSDWNNTDSESLAFIKNKPTIPVVSNTYSAVSTQAMSGIAVASAISQLPHYTREFYDSFDELPDVGSDTVLYFVLKESAGESDYYDEYIWATNRYEYIGSTSIDLSNYYNKTQTDDLLDDKVDKVEGKGLSTVDFQDDNYVHTDNNFSDTYKGKIDNLPTSYAPIDAEKNVQSDWNVTDTTSDAYIKNKPTSMPASDVKDWAKADTKPTYTATEVGALPSTTTHLSGDVPTSRKINNKSLTSDITLKAEDVGALPSTTQIPSVSATQILTDGVKIGSVTVNSTITEFYAPQGGSEGSTVEYTPTRTGGSEIGKLKIDNTTQTLYAPDEVTSTTVGNWGYATRTWVQNQGYKTTDTNTTYTLTQDATDGHKITLTPSTGTSQTITIPDNDTWRPVVDNVSSTSTTSSLSANQGRLLNNAISGKYTKPTNGIPKSDLASSVQTSLGLADSALQSYTETDPTVPAWAKASTKPSYTASEVGALPDTTTLSDLSEYYSEDTDAQSAEINTVHSKVYTDDLKSEIISSTDGTFTDSTSNYVRAKNGTGASAGVLVQGYDGNVIIRTRSSTDTNKPIGFKEANATKTTYMGTSDISNIGDGTILGAISALNESGGGDYNDLDNTPITNLVENSLRIWGTKSGTYHIKKGCVLYYSGATATNSVTITCDTLLFIDADTSTSTTYFYFFRTYSSSRYIYNGYTTSTSGTYNTFNLGLGYLTSISSYVKNNLTYATSSTSYALSAYQGKVLKDLVDGLDTNKQDKLNTYTESDTGVSISSNGVSIYASGGNISLNAGSGDYNISAKATDLELRNQDGDVFWRASDTIFKDSDGNISITTDQQLNVKGGDVDIESDSQANIHSNNGVAIYAPTDYVLIGNNDTTGVNLTTGDDGGINFMEYGASGWTSMGTTSIAGVGDGTILGAISSLNSGKQSTLSTEVANVYIKRYGKVVNFNANAGLSSKTLLASTIAEAYRPSENMTIPVTIYYSTNKAYTVGLLLINKSGTLTLANVPSYGGNYSTISSTTSGYTVYFNCTWIQN